MKLLIRQFGLSSKSSSEEQKPVNPALLRLHMVEHLDYKQDKSLSSASIVSKNPKQFLRWGNKSASMCKWNYFIFNIIQIIERS